MNNWFDQNSVYVELRMQEMRAVAEEARRLRSVRGTHTMRRQVGGALIAAGRRLSR